ncbi:Endoplasmic reticulum aminopeptidase 1 [Thelohanellus kitauei]|uniref:Endoplasmic reticulum aminopeptidase 1 n=1 Tax=Thelohanellus kitauei TaxID=669202 RepID=A0A0C2MMI0_THEKT|nr:Endoplasmic reticulum aminopeptidase 1 [Thelohanellus kitauei]
MSSSGHAVKDALRFVAHLLYLLLIFLILYLVLKSPPAKDVPKNISCKDDAANRKLIKSGRLPKNVKPDSYFLSYSFTENMDTYNASTDIHVTILAQTKTIVLHSYHHEILSVSLKNHRTHKFDASYTKISEICFIQETKMMILKLNRQMGVGEQATISILFRGNVSGSLNGIYSSVYVSKTNQTKKIISTQFQPDLARTAFPCFDEPSFKAVFVIKLSFPTKYKALSNAAILKQVRNIVTKDLIDTATHSVEFKPTVLMSSYLVAFAIHDFDSVSTVTKSGTKVNVWLPSDGIEHGKFAIELAPKVLETYERLFNIPYQLEKLDLIGIPGFEAGAMENWGLITFRMTALLVNPKLSSTLTMQWVGQVIAHELAHQVCIAF